MSHHYSGPDASFPHGDARLDLTDLYAFPKPGSTGKSILIMNVHPSSAFNPHPRQLGDVHRDFAEGRPVARSPAEEVQRLLFQ